MRDQNRKEPPRRAFGLLPPRGRFLSWERPSDKKTPLPASSRYWRGNLRRVAGLLAAWLLLTMTPALFTQWLSFDFIGWPFPFWLAAYGAPMAYLIIVAIYAWRMDQADQTDQTDQAERGR